MKKLILFLVLTFTAGGASAQSVQLSTYYPSPFGMYDRIRLVPRIALGEPCDPGTLYVENTGTTLRFCGAAGTWGPLGTGVWVQSSDNIFPADTVSNPNLRVGIGTTAPEFKLSLDNDGGILAKGTYGSGATLATSGAGAKFIWYPRKAAFRVGTVSGSQWDDSNIGVLSYAMGYNTQASGSNSVALGNSVLTGGIASVGLGATLTIDGNYSAAIGNSITLPAGADYSFGLGYKINTTGVGGVGIGAYLTSVSYAATLGSGVDENNRLVNNTPQSLAIGFNSTIPTLFIGPSSGVGTTGNVGIGTTAPDAKLAVSGTAGNTIAAYANSNDAAIYAQQDNSIGLGIQSSAAQNYFSGNVGIGAASPDQKLHIRGGNLLVTSGATPVLASGLRIVAPISDTHYNWMIGAQQNVNGGLEITPSTAPGIDTFTSPTAVFMRTGNVGIGTADPGTNKLEVAGGPIKATGGFIVETRTTNPGSPATGQMWLCTDPAPYCDGS